MKTTVRTVSSNRAGVEPVPFNCLIFDTVEEWIEKFDEASILQMINQQYSRNVTNAVRHALQRGTPAEQAQSVADEYDPRRTRATGSRKDLFAKIQSGEMSNDELQKLLAAIEGKLAEAPSQEISKKEGSDEHILPSFLSPRGKEKI